MVKGAPQKLIFQNLFKQTDHPNLLSIYVTYLLLQSTILSNFAHLILPIWVFCHHSLSLSLSFSFTSHLLNISSVSNKLTNQLSYLPLNYFTLLNVQLISGPIASLSIFQSWLTIWTLFCVFFFLRISNNLSIFIYLPIYVAFSY